MGFLGVFDASSYPPSLNQTTIYKAGSASSKGGHEAPDNAIAFVKGCVGIPENPN